MKKFMPLLGLLLISYQASAGENNYEVSIQCQSRINAHSLVSFTASYQTEKLDKSNTPLRLLPSGKISRDQVDPIYLELLGNPHRFVSESDTSIIQDSMGPLGYDKASLGPVHSLKNLPISKYQDSTCEPSEMEHKKITQEITFSNPSTDSIRYDSDISDGYTYNNKNSLDSKIKANTLKLKFTCEVSVAVLNNSEACKGSY
ncbi:MAG: hypothetical protein ACXVCP_16415 [Bdellovibrio sp.]